MVSSAPSWVLLKALMKSLRHFWVPLPHAPMVENDNTAFSYGACCGVSLSSAILVASDLEHLTEKFDVQYPNDFVSATIRRVSNARPVLDPKGMFDVMCAIG